MKPNLYAYDLQWIICLQYGMFASLCIHNDRSYILGCNAPLEPVISSTPHCANNVQLVSLGLIHIRNIKFAKSNNDERVVKYVPVVFYIFFGIQSSMQPPLWCLTWITFDVVKLHTALSWQGDILFQDFFWQFLYTNKGCNISVIQLYRVCGIGLCLKVEKRPHCQWDCWNASLQLFWGLIWVN